VPLVKSAYIESSFGLCTRHKYTCVGHIPDNRHAAVEDKGRLHADPTLCVYSYLGVCTSTWNLHPPAWRDDSRLLGVIR